MNVLLGIGNDNHGDDGVGPYIAENIQNKKWVGINCGSIPENYIGVILRHNPEHIIIVDAADMKIEIGGIRIIPLDSIKRAGFSTHSLPLSLLVSYIATSTKAHITVIGIQPKHLQGALTSEIKKAANYIISLFTENRIYELNLLKEYLE